MLAAPVEDGQCEGLGGGGRGRWVLKAGRWKWQECWMEGEVDDGESWLS